MPANVIPVKAGEMTINMQRTIRMNMTPLTNIETFVPSVSYTTWISELSRLTIIQSVKDQILPRKLPVLTQVSSASLVEKLDILVDYRLIEVFSQISCNTLTQNVEDSRSHANTGSRYKDDSKHVEAPRADRVEVTLRQQIDNFTDEEGDR